MHIGQSGEQFSVGKPPTPVGRTASYEPMEVQTTDEVKSILPRSDTCLKSARPKNRTISNRQTVTITVDRQAGIYRADSAIFSKEATTLPYSQLAEIEGFLQQTDANNANDPNRETNRVFRGPSTIAGFGAFAKRPYQPREIIGFYTGNLVLRKPMPERLHTRYLRLTKKKWRDLALPLYSVWRHSSTGDVQYQTGADTYIAWSQVKIYNKGIELGIDGEHSDNPLHLLNHSHKPNTTLLPTVNPKMLQHIRTDGQTYVKADVNLAQCLLIPVLALGTIEKDQELTFHYRGQGYPGYLYNFDETGKDIVSNPEVMMTQKPGEFPEYIRPLRGGYPVGPGTAPRMGKGAKLSQPGVPQPPQDNRETTTGYILAPASARLPTRPLPHPGIVVHDLCIPLSPIRLDQESDQDFAARAEQLINRSGRTIPIESSYPSRPGMVPAPKQQQSNWDSDRESVDPEEDGMTSSEDELCAYEDWDSGTDSPLNLDHSSEDEPTCALSKTSLGDNLAHSSQTTTPLPRKRPAPWHRKKYSLKDRASWVRRRTLCQRLTTAASHEHPDLIWNLFSAYQSTGYRPLISRYGLLCAVLNRRAIPHDIEGEEPEWVPTLAYHYFVNHGYIDGQSATEKYRLMPITVFKQLIMDNKDNGAPDQVEQFALQWLRRQHFHCTFLVHQLHIYRLKQRDGSPWDLTALYGLIKAHPLSEQEFLDWQAAAPDNQALGIGLWNLTRAGSKKAFHALIQSYFSRKNHNINLVLFKLNGGFQINKGFFNIDTPLVQATLLQYIIHNSVLDLDDSEIFRCIVPWELHKLINILTLAEKQHLAYKKESSSPTDMTEDQIKEKLFRDFISDSPEQRDQNLAKNLLHLYQLKRACSYRQKIIYNSLVALLNSHGVHTACHPKWSEQTIYDFWRSQGVLDQATTYSVMSFSNLQNCVRQSEDPKKQVAHFFHHWIKIREPQTCIRQLIDHGITDQGEPYTVTKLCAIMTEYNLPFMLKDLSQYQVNTDLKNDRSLQELPMRIRQQKDKEALKKYIEQWLIRLHNREASCLGKIAKYIKEALEKKGTDNKQETLKQFSDAFNAEVWTPKGLVKFIIDEGILDFSNPESFTHLAPAEAGLILPDAYCLNYACYAISQGTPARFISVWEKHCQTTCPEFSSTTFYGALGRYLVSNPPTFPYTHEQIKSRYTQVYTLGKQQLTTLLKLETLQFQTAFGYQQSPDSLLILISLLQKTIAINTKKVIDALQNFQIKIPHDAQCIVTKLSQKLSPDEEPSAAQGSLQGQAETINWIRANLIKLLALHDQKFKDRPRAAQTETVALT